MAVSKKPESEMSQATKIHKAPEKQLGQANVEKKSTSQPPNDLANATSSKSDKTVADVIVSTRKSVVKIQRKQFKTRARGLVRRSKTGKGRRRRRMPTAKSRSTAPASLREEISAGPSWQPKEDGAGCYCQELKEGVRQEGAVRGQFLEGKVLVGEDKVEEDKVREDKVYEDQVEEDEVHRQMAQNHVQDKGQDDQVLEREVQGSREAAGIRCWVCRLRGMAKKCRQLRGNRI